ncbi:MAG TPA: hypothetical protein VHE35_20045, partial [Kofleriaceae bacterium]|nr:hypothetical protein [Kofleriaceae bacterium]
PRFSGNFVNSSYGVPPTVPMPSFPAPGLGITARVAPMAGVELRAGAYEGAPAVGELAGWRRADGVVELGAVVVTHALRGRAGAGVHSLGVWRHTATGVDGVFGSADLRLYLSRDPDDDRSVQGFARAGYAPDAGGLDAQAYIGGGATLHGVLGRRNTIGAGAAWIRFADRAEAFVELFYKLRPLPWLTFEPDSQLYRLAGRTELVAGLRARIKL